MLGVPSLIVLAPNVLAPKLPLGVPPPPPLRGLKDNGELRIGVLLLLLLLIAERLAEPLAGDSA